MSGYEHDHCEIQLQQAVEKAVREEREAVAMYLRRLGEHGFEDIAQRIARGEHRK